MFAIVRKLEGKIIGTADTLKEAAVAMALAVKAGESNLDIVKVSK